MRYEGVKCYDEEVSIEFGEYAGKELRTWGFMVMFPGGKHMLAPVCDSETAIYLDDMIRKYHDITGWIDYLERDIKSENADREEWVKL